MDRGVWWATVRGVTKSQTQLSDWASMLTPLLSPSISLPCIMVPLKVSYWFFNRGRSRDQVCHSSIIQRRLPWIEQLDSGIYQFGWHHQLSAHEFEQTLGDSEGQGNLVCYSPWGCRVGHDLVTEQQRQLWTLSFPCQALKCLRNSSILAFMLLYCISFNGLEDTGVVCTVLFKECLLICQPFWTLAS